MLVVIHDALILQDHNEVGLCGIAVHHVNHTRDPLTSVPQRVTGRSSRELMLSPADHGRR